MKYLVAMCLLAAGASASYGDYVVNPDGTLVQFTREQADNIAVIGESGVVMNDGTHIQFDLDTAAFHNNAPAQPMTVPMMLEMQGPYGHSGLVNTEGNNVQFTAAQAGEIVLIGPGGVVMADGSNLQLDADGYPSRTKREVLLEGPSGLFFTDGQKRHLTRDVYVVLMTSSGAVLSNGDNVQFRKKRAVTYTPVVGEAGIITSSGRQIQFPLGVKVLIKGGTGVLLSNGEAMQLYD